MKTHNYTFDVNLSVVVRVRATEESAARTAVDLALGTFMAFNQDDDFIADVNGTLTGGQKIIQLSITPRRRTIEARRRGDATQQ